jgi:hypothetical protein
MSGGAAGAEGGAAGAEGGAPEAGGEAGNPSGGASTGAGGTDVAGSTSAGGSLGVGGSDVGGSTSSGGAGAGGGSAGTTSSGGAGAGGGGAGTSAGSAGAAGGSTTCQDGATQRCCQDGHQTCTNGVWGACQGAIITAESCNGVDDDCNGQVDDLGTFSCGVGACAATVTACGPNGVNQCVPGTPAPGPDGCDGIDNDCDGAVDEDCEACVHVAPDGDDTAASGNSNATPFLTVQAAIDFADAHPEIASRVCVAAGAACGANTSYAGPANADLTMRNGVDLLANYESTTWTRCTNSTTHLAPQTSHGVYFPSGITQRTNLDGFIVDRPATSTTTGVTVDGAKNVVLSNLTLPLNALVTYAYGVVLENGADALVYKSRIEAGNGSTESMGVKSVDSRLLFESNSSTGCASGLGILHQSSQVSSAHIAAIELDDSPGSRIESSDICLWLGDRANGDRDAIYVHGDATDVVIRDDDVEANSGAGSPSLAALGLMDCAGAAPWIVDNRNISLTTTNSATTSNALYALGDCHPVIDSNVQITTMPNFSVGLGVALRCGTSNGVDSRCIVSKNGQVSVQFQPNLGSSFMSLTGTAVSCENASCARIDRNVIRGMAATTTYGMSSSDEGTGYGVVLNGSGALVDRNDIVGNSGLLCDIQGAGITSTGPARIQNNRVIGTTAFDVPTAYSGCHATNNVVGISAGPADVHSNSVSAWPAVTCTTTTGSGETTAVYGILSSGGGTFRNNALAGCVAFKEASATGDPLFFEHNALSGGYLNETATYPVVAGNPDPRLSAAQVNALTDMTTDGNIDSACYTGSTPVLAAGSACIDAGTTTGAPALDYKGQLRDALPDIGSDEFAH